LAVYQKMYKQTLSLFYRFHNTVSPFLVDLRFLVHYKNILVVFFHGWNGYFGEADPHSGDIDPPRRKWFKEQIA